MQEGARSSTFGNARAEHIERPRSTLSPEVGKPTEIWTPDKAIAVAKQLQMER